MQEDNHVFQGLRRDNHQIRQDAKFLWDAHNIRITNREDNTLLSLTNEKGTSEPLVTFNGYYVGHCVLGKYLVVFTANDDASGCTIYRVEKLEEGGYKTIILFKDISGQPWWSDNSKGWSPNHPIEAIGVYETEFVQKVYWVDGVSQPRVINIAKPELKLPKYIEVDGKPYLLLIDGVCLSGPDYSTDYYINQYLMYEYPQGFYMKESFDFIRRLDLQEKVDVTKRYGQGEFSSGTIQYALSYYNKYEQESNICYITPLYYISPKERGGSPEEKVSCSFDIQIWGADPNFDYVRIFSIHRTSIDAVPTVKQVADVPTHRDDLSKAVTYCDTGTVGETIDPTRLLYTGGRSIIPECIVQKDNTLFLGNYELESDKHLDDIKEVASDWELDDYSIPTNHGPVKTEGVYYSYEPSLGYANGAGFKAFEYYRYGIQVQYDTGEWSGPIFLGDGILCNDYPWNTYPYRDSTAIRIMGNTLGRDLRNYGVRKIRTCIVFPQLGNTDIICQGIICPTLRRANADYTYLSSWFFRPSTLFTGNNNDVYHGAVIEFKHNFSLKTGADRGAEIQNMTPALLDTDEAGGGGNGFMVDENVVTFHSPDIEFNPSISSVDFSGTKLRIVGIAKLGATYGDIDIQTSSPGINKTGYYGSVSPIIGYVTGSKLPFNGGLVAGLFYHDNQVKKNGSGEYSSGDTNCYWLVYPWHRSGSLNNDERRGDDKAGSRTAVLQKKKMSNLKFFDENSGLLGSSPIYYDISTPQLFSATELSLIKLHPSYLNKDASYLGNVDMMITGETKYSIYQGKSFTDTIVETAGENVIQSSSEPVRIKYKSSPHLVFSLGSNKSDIELLPRHISLGDEQNSKFTPPAWMREDNTSIGDRTPYDGTLHLYTTDVLSSGGPNGSYNTPADASLLGKYAIGRWTNTVSGKSVYGLHQCRNGKRGVAWIHIPVPEDGLILKAKDTLIKPNNHYLPGTTSSDYYLKNSSQARLMGKIKYYKITGGGQGSDIQITDVTSELTADSPSGTISYNLKRKVFGNTDSSVGCPYLLIGEIIREDVSNRFGEDGETGTMNMWVPAGDPVAINDNDTTIIIPFQYGDTWYGRYDCLKTYPFTQEDENQMVEIGSFMCETRVNIDGRYDRNRGQLSNLNMTPQNFNLLNEVYSQKDNFFNYRTLDKDYYKQSDFANQVTWSREKHSGEETDTWTNITLANTLDMDGEKGKVTALRTWNEYLLCFQEKALSQILFNSRVQIPTTDGVPIEISNGYKVDGSRLLSGNIGCSNKWATATTSTGIYFLDSNTDSLYIFNGQLANLSEDRGMDWWVRQNHTDKIWKPVWHNVNTLNGIRAFYDNKYGDIYFTPGQVNGIDQPDALCYSEQLGQFTSLMSYGGTQAMFNFADGFYSLRETDGNVKLYENNVGDYNNFYGETKGWNFSFISNQNPTLTKVFDTIELRADRYNGDTLVGNKYLTRSQPGQPFNFIRVNNEYQDTRWYDEDGLHDVMFDYSNLRKKFRVWRGLIPRNHSTRQRIRNPWTKVTLGWTPRDNRGFLTEGQTDKVVVHDVSVKYTI